MKIKIILLLLVFLFPFLSNQKTVKEEFRKTQPEVDSIRIFNNKIYYYYKKVFENSLLDKIHGYHKMSAYFTSPYQLAAFLNDYKNGYSHIQFYIESLKQGDYTGKKQNAVAIFSDYYWKLVNELYDSMPCVALNDSIRSVQFPLDRIQGDILDQLDSAFIYIPQITVMIDFSKSLINASSLIIGDPDEFEKYLNKGMESVFKDYFLPPKANRYSSFPFTELPLNIAKAFSFFKETGLNFDEFTRHLSQYRISPTINTHLGGISEFELRFTTDVTSTNIIRIPIPIVLRRSMRNEIYIENAARAIIGNLLRTGISRDFIIIIKLAHISHRSLFEQFIKNTENMINQPNEYYRIIDNARIDVSNPETLFHRFKLVPNYRNANSIKKLNKAIKDAKEKLENEISENTETRHRYFTKTKWQQVIIFQPQKR